MGKKSTIFFFVFILFVAGSIAFSYYRYMVKHDYIIVGQVDCDPIVDKCFVWHCDPEAIDGSEKCTGDPDQDIWYYRLVQRNAMRIPECDPKAEGCVPFDCTDGEPDCQTIYCDETTMAEQEVSECNDPVQYNVEHPVEEDGAAVSDEALDGETADNQSESQGDGTIPPDIEVPVATPPDQLLQ